MGICGVKSFDCGKWDWLLVVIKFIGLICDDVYYVIKFDVFYELFYILMLRVVIRFLENVFKILIGLFV